jgi:hypothetical protein
MRYCQKLKHLHIVVDDNAANVSFDLTGLSLPWKHLQSLKLDRIVLLENEFADFLIEHHSTVAWVETEDCRLEDGTWESLYKKLEPYFPGSERGSDEYAGFSSENWPLYLAPIWPAEVNPDPCEPCE